MHLFYNPVLDHSTTEFSFSAEESRHIAKVLRKTKGDLLMITNGKGDIFEATIVTADLKKCKAQITRTKSQVGPRHTLHMAVAPTKMNDRFEWFLEKATEIGVTEITPILCDRSERKMIKTERFEKIIQAAMKQSMQAFMPQLNPLTPFEEFIAQNRGDQLFIAHCEEEEKEELHRRVAADKDVVILIGPEGDFSKSEIAIAQEKGFIPVSLGKNRLRTETAAIVACSTVALINS